MNHFHRPAIALCLALALAMSALLGAALPALADQPAPNPNVDKAADQGLNQVLGYLDQTWLMPNGLSYDYMVGNEPTDLAILLGLAMRSQTPHVEQNPGLQPALNRLATEGLSYLRWLAEATPVQYDPWGNPLSYATLHDVYELAITTNHFDQYSMDRYGIDPVPLVYDDLLTPIAQAEAGVDPAPPGPSGKFEAKEESDSIILLGVEAEPVDINVQPWGTTPEPEPQPQGGQ